MSPGSAMTSPTPARTIRATYFALAAFAGLQYGLFAPVRVLYLESRLLTGVTVAAVLGLYSIVSGFAEIPTGSLADSWSRRRTLLVGALGNFMAIALLAFTGLVPVVAAAMCCKALAGALASGSAESWFVDEASACGGTHIVRDVARAATLENAGIAVGAVLAALAPVLFSSFDETGDAPVILLTPVLLVLMATIAVEFGVVHRCVHDGRPTAPRGDVWRTTWRTLGAGLRTARAEPVVRRILLNFFVSTMAVASFEILTPLRLEDASSSAERSPSEAVTVFGITIAVAFVCGALTAGLAPRIDSRFSTPGRGAGAVTLATAVVLCVALLPGSVPVVVGYLGLWLVGAPVAPLLRGELHPRVSADQRATLLSTGAFAAMVGAGVGAILSGPLAEAVGYRWAFVFPTAMMFVGAAALLVGELPPPAGSDTDVVVAGASETG